MRGESTLASAALVVLAMEVAVALEPQSLLDASSTEDAADGLRPAARSIALLLLPTIPTLLFGALAMPNLPGLPPSPPGLGPISSETWASKASGKEDAYA